MGTLRETNKYLLDPEIVKQMTIKHVISSSSIEGVNITPEELEKFEPTMDSNSDEYIQKLQLKSQEKDIEEIRDKLIDQFVNDFSCAFEDCSGYVEERMELLANYLRVKFKELL